MTKPVILTPETPATGQSTDAAPATGEQWLTALRTDGPGYDQAVRHVHALVRRAAACQLARMPQIRAELGPVRTEEVIDAAAGEATMAVLANLDAFEGRSRFTTWVYKFGIWHAAGEARRTAWRERPLHLDEDDEPTAGHEPGPESYAEARDLADALTLAIRTALTTHQRRVVTALLLDEIPVDVLAERLGTSRNALYKTLHDARAKLRSELTDRGYLNHPPTGKASR